MDKKIGRNDPCPCGSGKKYKQCCIEKATVKRHKLTAKWLNAPEAPNLMEKVYGNAEAYSHHKFTQLGKSISTTIKEEVKDS